MHWYMNVIFLYLELEIVKDIWVIKSTVKYWHVTISNYDSLIGCFWKGTNDDTEELLENLSEAKHKSQGYEGKALENVSSSNMELEKDEFEVNCLISTWNSMQSSFRYIWKGSTWEFQRMYSKNEEFYIELFRISSSGEQWKSQCAASL